METMENVEKVEVSQLDTMQVIEAQDRAFIDKQIATAKQYPRDIKRAANNSVAVATMDIETAKSCGYALPRGGKTISGPSVHLARILAQNWGNLRVESRITEINATQIVSQSVCFDLETNYAVKVEVRRRITDKYNKRFSDDMITVAGNAANSISFRNAVFNVIPKAVTEKVYKATRNTITGDISSEEQLIKRRVKALEYFKEKYGATEQEILSILGIGSVNAIRQDEIVILTDLDQAIKDGDTTPEEAFQRKSEKEKQAAKKADDIKNKIKDKIKGQSEKDPSDGELFDQKKKEVSDE